ncbi:Hypothetical protein A7982_06352 [Minicystis rosea]|nr:Hypothetical protein A7982_06352 [Minicystis rosea]
MAAPSGRMSIRLLRARPNPWWIALALSPISIVAAAAVVGLPLFPLSFLAALLVVAGFFSMRTAHPVLEPVHVHADEHGLEIGALHVSSTEIREALVMPGAEPRILLRRRGLRPPIDLRGGSIADGRALLRAIGHDPSRTTVTFKTNAWLGRAGSSAFWGVFFAACAWVAPSWMVSAPFFAFCALLALRSFGRMAAALLYHEQLSVGPDGVRHVLGWVWKRVSYFLGYHHLVAVVRHEAGLSLRLRSGQTVHVEIESSFERMGQPPHDEVFSSLIEERIAHAMEALGSVDATTLSALRRGDRSPRAWLDALRALGSGANVDMRNAPVSRERLLEIVEGPFLSTVDRVAAAMALSATLDGDACDRLRRVMEKTVDKFLALTLERILLLEELGRVAGPDVVAQHAAGLAETLAGAEGFDNIVADPSNTPAPLRIAKLGRGGTNDATQADEETETLAHAEAEAAVAHPEAMQR